MVARNFTNLKSLWPTPIDISWCVQVDGQIRADQINLGKDPEMIEIENLKGYESSSSVSILEQEAEDTAP